MRRWVLAAAIVAVAAPAFAAEMAPETIVVRAAPRTLSAAERAVPSQVPPAERTRWRAVMADLRAQRWDAAAAGARVLSPTPLTAFVEAEVLLARGPAAAGIADPAAWLMANADLPQAGRIAAKLRASGFTTVADAPQPRQLIFVGSERAPLRSERDLKLEAAVKADTIADRPEAAEARFRSVPDASPGARAEWAQKIAWSYYRAGDDRGAIRMGALAADGPGEAGALGAWVAGLASWRTDDCATAATQFDRIATKDAPDDLAAAGAYWASRAYLACGAPQNVASRLRAAATRPTGFYGLLARRALGLDAGLDWSEPDFIKADWNYLQSLPGARRAAALVEVGELGLADRQLKHLAGIAEASRYGAILRLAARLSLPATQLWLSSRSPDGARPPLSARFPAPDWTPPRGWRVDQALVYAHALQESRFVTDAVSARGARGVMQLMPATGAKVASNLGLGGGELADPAFNIECGQSYLEELRDMSYTGGLLPKVIAAYNAGPGSVQKWNAQVRDNGDPLLFIESIPFKETRAYVEIVLRNYWMYELRDGRNPASMTALAQGMWPKFPGMPGATAVRMPRGGVLASAAP
jgi:soluble lytic murein transglycosylase-like protein